MKRLIILTVMLTALFGIYVKADVKNDTVTIDYLDEKSKEYNIIYANGRLYVPFFEICNDFEIDYEISNYSYILTKDGMTNTVSTAVRTNKSDMYFYNDMAYVYIYELIEPFGNIPVIDINNNKISIYKSVKGKVSEIETNSNSSKKAYIRLEDIMADGMDKSLNPNYTVTRLEELRYTAQYLYDNNQHYYISWIPVYANPRANYWNDVSAYYDLYNSYFVYTLDFMIEHNGHIGLHGYTHQYGNDISAIGYEWGPNTPFSATEQENRIKKAIECANRLGFNIEFFEFPHYGATKEQINIASKYFDLIYQNYPDENLKNAYIYSSESGKKIYYMPTPADFLHTKYDINNMLLRISNCIENNYPISLFYHPIIDSNAIYAETNGDERLWSYNDGCLQKILKYISDKGYVFSQIPK